MDYEVVIGLEVHVQLQTLSKVFGTAPTNFGAKPNSNIDPVSLGLPGSLPVTNHKAIELAIILALATNSEINHFNRFARKHYFYPDSPKGYQITQFEEPICERGSITIRSAETQRTIGLRRIHIEEDAGKSIHLPERRCSLVDLNRAGVPLVEIVTEPEIRSAQEASAFLRALRQLVRWLGISDGNMEEGSLRCDANVSLRPLGQLKFGTRTEIKNLNSFKFVEKAIEYETARQIKILRSDEDVKQETLLFDSQNEVTRPMRGKEEALDYRYFPDPDLPPLLIEDSWIESIRQDMPVLPAVLVEELVAQFDLSLDDALVITSEKEYFNYYKIVEAVSQNPKAACSWVTTELFGKLNRVGTDFNNCPISAEKLGQLIKLIDQEVISGRTAKVVFEELWREDKDPEQIVKEKNLQQITDPKLIVDWITHVLDNNPEQIIQFHSGNIKLKGFFVGQIMKLASGNASPSIINELLEQELQKRK